MRQQQKVKGLTVIPSRKPNKNEFLLTITTQAKPQTMFIVYQLCTIKGNMQVFQPTNQTNKSKNKLVVSAFPTFYQYTIKLTIKFILFWCFVLCLQLACVRFCLLQKESLLPHKKKENQNQYQTATLKQKSDRKTKRKLPYQRQHFLPGQHYWIAARSQHFLPASYCVLFLPIQYIEYELAPRPYPAVYKHFDFRLLFKS